MLTCQEVDMSGGWQARRLTCQEVDRSGGWHARSLTGQEAERSEGSLIRRLTGWRFTTEGCWQLRRLTGLEFYRSFLVFTVRTFRSTSLLHMHMLRYAMSESWQMGILKVQGGFTDQEVGWSGSWQTGNESIELVISAYRMACSYRRPSANPPSPAIFHPSLSAAVWRLHPTLPTVTGGGWVPGQGFGSVPIPLIRILIQHFRLNIDPDPGF
jgi:hypothetical protein